MTSKAPPIPPEQRSFHGAKPDLDDGLPSRAAGNAGVNLKEQGRYGNRRQNVDAVQHKVQDR
jgi:hypothetical protein